MSNSVGNTNRDVRKFCREHGIKPNAANVDIISREVRRTENENERLSKMHQEIGSPKLVDNFGRDVAAVRREAVRRKIESRPEPEERKLL